MHPWDKLLAFQHLHPRRSAESCMIYTNRFKTEFQQETLLTASRNSPRTCAFCHAHPHHLHPMQPIPPPQYASQPRPQRPLPPSSTQPEMQCQVSMVQKVVWPVQADAPKTGSTGTGPALKMPVQLRAQRMNRSCSQTNGGISHSTLPP